MSIYSNDNRIIFGGASVIGSSHLKENINKQDFYLIKKYRGNYILAVADGLGSRKKSKKGSRQACYAIYDAAKIALNRKNEYDSELFIRLVHHIWRFNIYPDDISECGTTCLFVIISNEGKIFMGQLGDGMIAYSVDSEWDILSEKDDEFINITNSLDNVKNITEWKYKTIYTNDKITRIMLSTDGFCNDLKKDKIEKFMDDMYEKLNSFNDIKERSAYINDILLHGWRGCSGDDKTLVFWGQGVN